MMRVNITELRANLLNYLNKARRGEHIIVTSNGQPLATIVAPLDQKQLAKTKLKKLSKTAKVHDVTSPIDTQWDVLK